MKPSTQAMICDFVFFLWEGLSFEKKWSYQFYPVASCNASEGQHLKINQPVNVRYVSYIAMFWTTTPIHYFPTYQISTIMRNGSKLLLFLAFLACAGTSVLNICDFGKKRQPDSQKSRSETWIILHFFLTEVSRSLPNKKWTPEWPGTKTQ